MLKRPKLVLFVVTLAALLAAEVRHLVITADAGKREKISRQEFMNSMAAEFDRLDKDKRGELDVKQLTQLQLSLSRAPIGK